MTMAPPHSKTALGRNKGIKVELNALKKEFCRVNSTATCFKVSHVILDQHWARDKSVDKANESQHLLTSIERKHLLRELIEWQ